MEFGARYDLEAVRRKAQADKRKARNKAIVSNVIAGVVLIAVAIGGKIGWDAWRRSVAEKEAAENARAAEESRRRALEEKRRQAEIEEAAARRRAEKAEREAQVARENARREAERQAREEERQRIAAEREAERKAREEERAWQVAHKGRADVLVSQRRFSVSNYVVTEVEYENAVRPEVDGEKWSELSSLAANRNTIDFLKALNDGSVTSEFSETHYPDGETVDKLLALLDKEQFTMVVRVDPDVQSSNRLILCAADPKEGLAAPVGARPLLDQRGRVEGWTFPFRYKCDRPLFVMRTVVAEKFVRDWQKTLRTVNSRKGPDVQERLDAEFVGFVSAIKIELATPRPAQPVQPAATPKPAQPKKSGSLLKGSGSESGFRNSESGFRRPGR